MKTKEQLQAEIIEKYKKLVDFYELQFNVDLKQRNYGLKLRSELSALTAELEKEGEESISAPCPHFEECRNGGKNKYCDVETFTQIDCFMTNNRQ